MSIDPQTIEIKTICESLIGATLQIGYNFQLSNGNMFSGDINNCNIIGDCMEDILYPFIKKHIPTFEKGPKQTSPDFYNSKIWHYELKCFHNTPGFDISNFNSYVYKLRDDLETKMFRTQYLIFKYSFDNGTGTVKIIDFKLCHVWNLINYNGKYPISLQCKKGIWYNIRPCSFQEISTNKTPIMFVKKICEAIDKTPNKIEQRETIIHDIFNQFYRIEYSRITKVLHTSFSK